VTPEGATGLAHALLSEPPDEEGWRRFRRVRRAARGLVIHALKAVVDERMLQSPRKALEAAEVLMRAAEYAPDERHVALRGLANALHYSARHQEARAAYEEALETYDRLPDWRDAATIRRNLVDVYMYLGDSAGALSKAEEARALLVGRVAPLELARLENNIGNVYVRLDEYPLARQHYERALRGLQALGNQLGTGITAFNLGIVEMNANDVDASERCLRTARAAFEAEQMALHVADCDYNLAYLLSRRGRWKEAIDGLELARVTYLQIGKPSGPPLCDLDLAEIYLRLDARHNALTRAQLAAKGFKALSLDYEAARCGILVGLAYVRHGKPNEALDELQAAATAFSRLGNQAAAAAVDVQRGAIEIEAGALAEAIARLRAARETLDKRELRFLTDLAGVTLARAYLACGETALASHLLESLLAQNGDAAAFDLLLKADALNLLATVRRAEGDASGAMQALRASVDVTERNYAEIPFSDIRVAFFRDRHLAYVELVWDLAEQGSSGARNEALRLLEESRARSLSEAQGPPLAVSAEFRSARSRLDWLLARHVDAAFGQGAEHDLRQAAPASAEIRAAQDEVLKLACTATDGGPVRRLADAELFEAARGAGDVLVFFVTGPRGVRALLYDGGGSDDLIDVRLGIDESELARLRDRLWLHADKLRFGAEYARTRAGLVERTFASILERLGTALVLPLLEHIDGRRIVVVPFGDLHDLPIHAFRVQGEPLALRCELSYALSASSLAEARRAPASGDAIVACGASPSGMEEIQGELEDLGRLFPALRRLEPEELIGSLEVGSLGGRVLHLAAHALYRHRRPVFSGICLGERSLLAHDIQRLRMPFDLIVLSGCETGRHRRVPGEECYGLSRALFGAGARAVVGSLWAVDDAATRLFMRTFYGELSHGTPARTALARTQRLLVADGHPTTTWAAFGLLGDPEIRVTSPNARPETSS
jgi:tetratricopeptide (TPR) repeat protein